MEELASLIAAAVAGDMGAYESIVRRFQSMAHGYAYSILGDFPLSEDAAQEAFVEAHHKLADLRTPEAFPGWLRRIVFKHCDRLTRRKRVSTVPLEYVPDAASDDPTPVQISDRNDMRQRVLAAVRSLPEQERTVTALFYITGHSQREVAEFLGVPVSTVKSRLHTARTKLRGRLFDMLRDTLKETGVDERFSKNVIDALLGQPHPLDMPDHPVRKVYETISAALPDYQVVDDGEETATESGMMDRWSLQFAYRPSSDTILRTETMAGVFEVAATREPPVKLITAGRVFQAFEDKHPIRHELTVLCVEPAADEAAMKATAKAIVESIFGSVDVAYGTATFHWFDPCYTFNAKIAGNWTAIGGCGVMTSETLAQFGFDSAGTGGFVIAIGQLERLAMLKGPSGISGCI